jgi:hypothetical protein
MMNFLPLKDDDALFEFPREDEENNFSRPMLERNH